MNKTRISFVFDEKFIFDNSNFEISKDIYIPLLINGSEEIGKVIQYFYKNNKSYFIAEIDDTCLGILKDNIKNYSIIGSKL